jgi:hypothetical protein
VSKWPVVNPPPHGPLHVNLQGAALPKSPNFDGPLNVLIELHGTATAANTVAATQKEYDRNYPHTPVNPEPTPTPLALGEPISTGRRIVYDKGEVDPEIKRRVK